VRDANSQVALTAGRRMAKVKALFFIPLKDNDGRDLRAEREELEAELYLRFVGLTSLGAVKGAFRMADGSQAIDESNSYMVVLEESRIGELEEVIRDFKAKTQQEAIYLEIQRSVEFRFV
jgi:hypothetical protein